MKINVCYDIPKTKNLYRNVVTESQNYIEKEN